MSERRSPKPEGLKFLFLALYFLILTVERIISLAVCFSSDFDKLDGLDYYMMALTILAVFGAYVYAFLKSSNAVRHHDEEPEKSGSRGDFFGNLAVAAGILLLGGMVHTRGSIPVMQFISYGMILISMAIHTLQCVKREKNADKKWLSFAYVTAFSMSIPVVYHTNMDIAYLFIPIEIAVSAGMVILFTAMLKRFYEGNAENNFSLLPFLAALFGDFFVLILRWHEEINIFVLIFICVTSVLWFAGNVMCIKRK